jgi:hypothetical protein
LSIGLIDRRSTEDELIADFLRTLHAPEFQLFRQSIDDHLRSPRGVHGLQLKLEKIDFVLIRRSRTEIFFRHVLDMIDAGPDSWPAATSARWRAARVER